MRFDRSDSLFAGRIPAVGGRPANSEKLPFPAKLACKIAVAVVKCNYIMQLPPCLGRRSALFFRPVGILVFLSSVSVSQRRFLFADRCVLHLFESFL